MAEKKSDKVRSKRGGRVQKINMFDYLSKKYGISRAWCAKQLGVTPQGFQYALERGLHEEEVQILEQAIKAMALDLMEIRIPDNMKYGKKEAA